MQDAVAVDRVEETILERQIIGALEDNTVRPSTNRIDNLA